MTDPRCPFCGHDPFHYVDIGVGYEAAAITCCDLGVDLFSFRQDESGHKRAMKVLADMRSYSPKRKARAMKALREAGLRDPSRAELRADREDA